MSDETSQKIYQEFDEILSGLSFDRLAIALSGGADSMALTLIANKWAKENGVKIYAISVDHNLRKDSSSELEQVAKWMKKHDINHHILTWQHDGVDQNIQSKARDARYQLMINYCKDHEISALLVAHNLEDQAETVLLNMQRGSGLKGLCGMEAIKDKEGVKIIRPLLNVSKKDLISFLEFNKQKWVEDPSNQNEDFTRVKIRQAFSKIEDQGLITQRICNMAGNLSSANNYLEEKLSLELDEVLEIHEEGFFTLDHKKFLTLHSFAKFNIVQRLLHKMSADQYPPRAQEVQLIINDIEAGADFKKTLARSIVLLKKGKVFFIRELSKISQDVKINHEDEVIFWDNRFKILLNKNLVDKFVGVLGKTGFERIFEAKDRERLYKIKPKEVFYTLPCLKTLEKPLFVPHIAYSASNEYKDLLKSKFLITEI